MTKSSATRRLDAPEKLHGELRSFPGSPRPTATGERRLAGLCVPVYDNAFWTSRQRAGHSLHEISYRACYKPQLPAFFITRLCRPGDVVYDPFMGRGTTLIEAQLHGCRALGNDANPLSGVLAAPRLNPPSIDQVSERLSAVVLPPPDRVDPDLLVFFAPQTLAELYGWRAYFRERKQSGRFDATDAWIQMVACSRLTGHSKGFFSVYTLPPNQATSVEAQRRINRQRAQTPEYRDTRALILRKTRQLLRHKRPAHYGRSGCTITCSSADHTPDIPSGSVRLVVTSPPFLDTVDYVGDNWLRTWFCEAPLDPEKIWQHTSLDDWAACMAGVFRELRRVLKPGGWIAFEVGEVRKGVVMLENAVVGAGCRAGLIPECIIIHSQNFTKTAHCWGVSNNRKGTNSNRIVVFRKTRGCPQ